MRLLRWGASSLLLVSITITVLVGLNVRTYQRLTGESQVADLHFSQIKDDLYAATMVLPDGEARRLELSGDDWQLDARMITWKPWLQILGNDPIYRLDRLSGRYRDIEKASRIPPSVYALSDNPGLDLWAVARSGEDWMPGIDAVYGTAVFVPMVNGASYRVTMSTKGLLVRPSNERAKSAISSWN